MWCKSSLRGRYEPRIQGGDFFCESGPKFTWLNASFAMKRQAVRLRPGPPINFRLKTLNFIIKYIFYSVSSFHFKVYIWAALWHNSTTRSDRWNSYAVVGSRVVASYGVIRWLPMNSQRFAGFLCSPQQYKADNGCPGCSCRGRTHLAAILVGKEPKSCDPAVSEWSNPSRFYRDSSS